MKSLLLFVLALAVAQELPQKEWPWLNSKATPEERAQQLLAQMTQAEKITMIHGASGSYVGNVPANTRLGIPPLNLNDGPQGFRDNAHHGTTTQWPGALTVSQTWNATTLYAFGAAMGAEFVGKGANIQLGPGLNVARVPVNGRNFEYLSGEDPYLGRVAVKNVVQGIQSQHVIANAKHYINNNQETNRSSTSANLDERTRVEIYQGPFWGAVEAGVLSFMCSYNKINNVYACENSQTLNTELKGATYGNFSGFVMSDWGATHSTVNSANNGLDQEMPSGNYFSQTNIENAISAGTISQATLDNKVYRILWAMFSGGLFDYPITGNIANNVTSPAHSALTRAIAAEAIVLLKNANNVLPLSRSIAKIGVIGKACSSSVISGGGGSGSVVPAYVVSPLQGIQHAVPSANVTYCDGSNTTTCNTLAGQVDAVICCMATTSSEGSDRANLQLPSDETSLCQSVGRANAKTIAVTINPGAILTTPWDDSVAAILSMGMPGQEEGNALADVVFGAVNPSGRLPVTFPNKDNEVAFTTEQYPGVNNQANYTEKLNIGYRWYAANNVVPRYAFGYGLSYTTFAYSNLAVSGRTVTFTVTNSGSIRGADVPQLYIGYPTSSGEPPLQLRAFSKIGLNSGQAQNVSFTLTDRDLSIWNETSHAWALQHGTLNVFVGASSQDIRLKGTLTVS
jgi:beta-glucosidase